MSISYYYSLSVTNYSFVQDLDRRELKNLDYHIQQQDYFGTLATVLRLWYQGAKYSLKEKEFNQTLDELQHLQNNYLIKKK